MVQVFSSRDMFNCYGPFDGLRFADKSIFHVQHILHTQFCLQTECHIKRQGDKSPSIYL